MSQQLGAPMLKPEVSLQAPHDNRELNLNSLSVSLKQVLVSKYPEQLRGNLRLWVLQELSEIGWHNLEGPKGSGSVFCQG